MNKYDETEDDIVIGANIAKNIKKYRLKHSKSQEEIASYLNISRSAYSNYENGYRLLDIFHLRRLSRLYHVSIDIFFQNPDVQDMNTKQNKQ